MTRLWLAPALAPTDLDAGTPDAWVPRDPRVIRLTGRHPLNCEPSLDDLMVSGKELGVVAGG